MTEKHVAARPKGKRGPAPVEVDLERIRELRTGQGLSHGRIAEIMKISTTLVALRCKQFSIEKGATSSPATAPRPRAAPKPRLARPVPLPETPGPALAISDEITVMQALDALPISSLRRVLSYTMDRLRERMGQEFTPTTPLLTVGP